MRFLDLATILSLLLCIATAALWVRSYRFADSVIVNDGDKWTCEVITSTRGRMEFAIGQARAAGEISGGFRLTHESDSPYNMTPLPHEFGGVEWGPTPALPPWVFRPAFAVPHECLPAMLLLMPVAWLRRRLRTRRLIKQGQCVNCGYDLRASSERCPECGTPSAAPRRG